MSYEAIPAIVPDAVGVTPRTVVALPPSDADLYGGGFGAFAEQFAGGPMSGADEMRVYVDGALIRRAYDPALEQP